MATAVATRHRNTWFKPGRQTQLAITCNCLQAFLLFGYDQGVLGGLQTNANFLNTINHPGTAYLGFIVSSYNLGCMIGCLLNFSYGGRFGRRQAIWAAMAFVAVGAVLQCSTMGVPQLIVGRIITGVGVGIDTSTVPTYQAELCRPASRGRLVTTEVLFTVVGVSVAYFFDYGMNFTGPGSLAWRLPIACQILPAALVSVILFGLPETPRWLLQRAGEARVEGVGSAEGKERGDALEAEAAAVLAQVYGLRVSEVVDRGESGMLAGVRSKSETGDAGPNPGAETAIDAAEIRTEIASIKRAIALESRDGPVRWSRLLRRDRVQTGRRVGLACLALFMNQWAGVNVVVFYIATVLENNVGLPHDEALVVGGCVNLGMVVGSFVPALGLDRLGRKGPMMVGAAGAGVSMMMIAILLSLKGTAHAQAASSASIAFFITFMMFFGASMNAIPWCYSAEILPLRARAKGTSLAVFLNWVWVFTIVMATPTMIDRLAWKTYLIFMAFNFVFIPTVYFLMPETKGISLEEIDDLFTTPSTSDEEERGVGGLDANGTGIEKGKGGIAGDLEGGDGLARHFD